MLCNRVNTQAGGGVSDQLILFVLQMTGTWFLLNTASKCSFLIRHGSKVEPTLIRLTYSAASNRTLSVSTKTRQYVKFA